MTTISIGANQYEIHGTEAGANAYFGGRLGTPAWSSFTTTDRKRALVTSAYWLTRFEENPSAKWSGEKTGGPSQVLPWPRDNATCSGEPVPNGTTPGEIVTGEYELAYALLLDPTIQNALSTGTLLKRAKAGTAEVEFFGPTRGSADDTPVPAIVWQLIGCFLEGTLVPGPSVEGAAATSSFEDSPHFGLTEGYA